MRLALAVILVATSAPILAQDASQADAPKSKPKVGLRAETPNGPRLLISFDATGPLGDLRAIEAKLIEFNCPEVRVQENGDASHISVLFIDTCDREPTLAFMEEVVRGKFPSLHIDNVLALPDVESNR